MLLTSCADLGVVRALAQRLGEQAHRVQRLAQVVAGGGEELRLGAVGDLGLAARRVGDRLLGAQLHRELVGAQLQVDDALERVAVAAARAAASVPRSPAVIAAPSCQP